MISIEEELGAPGRLGDKSGSGIEEGGVEAIEDSEGASRKWWKRRL